MRANSKKKKPHISNVIVEITARLDLRMCNTESMRTREVQWLTDLSASHVVMGLNPNWGEEFYKN